EADLCAVERTKVFIRLFGPFALLPVAPEDMGPEAAGHDERQEGIGEKRRYQPPIVGANAAFDQQDFRPEPEEWRHARNDEHHDAEEDRNRGVRTIKTAHPADVARAGHALDKAAEEVE